MSALLLKDLLCIKKTGARLGIILILYVILFSTTDTAVMLNTMMIMADVYKRQSRDSSRPRPVSLGSRYFSWASSTWSLPSLLFARAAKISRISIVRSITRTFRCV